MVGHPSLPMNPGQRVASPSTGVKLGRYALFLLLIDVQTRYIFTKPYNQLSFFLICVTFRMPPKRKALESDPDTINRRSTAKKAKPATSAQGATPEPQLQDDLLQTTIKHRQQRWAEVSGSKNLDIEYQKAVQDPARAYEFMCVCDPFKGGDNAYDDDSEPDDDSDASDEGEEPNRQSCDNGKACPCGKSAALLPSHPYTMTRAGLARYHMAGDMMNLRDPDTFAMHTFNDHMAYGALEVVQNMLLDFDEAYKVQQWRESWAVVEGMALFMLVGEGNTMCMADDGDMIEETAEQIVRMVLTALALLEHKAQLANDTDIKNLSWVMGLYQEVAKSMQGQGLLDKAPTSNIEKFHAGDLNLYLQAYAHRCSITLPGVADASTEAGITMPSMDAKDPWDWATTFSNYQLVCEPPGYAYRGTHRRSIGGDGLDISTWTSAERKRHAFDHKDPLPRGTAKKLKEGLILALA